MPKPPDTSNDAVVAEKLARFIFSRGGSMPAALMSEFYEKHPDAQGILGGGKGKLSQLCCDYPEKLQFCKKPSGDTVELAPGWKARPLPHLPCINLCNIVSALHEKGALSMRGLGRLEADEKKAIAHCGGLEPLAYSYPELFRHSSAPGQDWALRFSLRLQNLWESLSARLSSVGKAECGHIIGQLYKEDEHLRAIVQTLGGAAGLAQAFRGSIELQRREKEPGIEQQLFVWRRVKKAKNLQNMQEESDSALEHEAAQRLQESGSAVLREQASKRTTSAGLPTQGDGAQKEAICCFWLQGECKESASHKFLNVMFLHEEKPGLFCANGATCNRHDKPGGNGKFQGPFITTAAGARSHTKEEKDRDATVTAAAPTATAQAPLAAAGKPRASRWGPSSPAAAAPVPAPSGFAAGQTEEEEEAPKSAAGKKEEEKAEEKVTKVPGADREGATRPPGRSRVESAPSAEDPTEETNQPAVVVPGGGSTNSAAAQPRQQQEAAQAEHGFAGVGRERRALERLSARLLGARDLSRRGSLEAWEEELEEVSSSLAEVCDRLAAREEEVQRREAALAQQQGSGAGPSSGSHPWDANSTDAGTSGGVAATASGTRGDEESGAGPSSGSHPCDANSTDADTSGGVAATASGTRCDEAASGSQSMQGSGAGPSSGSHPWDANSTDADTSGGVAATACGTRCDEASETGPSGGNHPLDTNSTDTETNGGVAATANDRRGDEAGGDGQSQKVDGADNSSEFNGQERLWERFLDPESGRVWWWNPQTQKAWWEEEPRESG